MEDVITGQEFSRATNMPARWLVDQASNSAPVPVSKALHDTNSQFDSVRQMASAPP